MVLNPIGKDGSIGDEGQEDVDDEAIDHAKDSQVADSDTVDYVFEKDDVMLEAEVPGDNDVINMNRGILRKDDDISGAETLDGKAAENDGNRSMGSHGELGLDEEATTYHSSEDEHPPVKLYAIRLCIRVCSDIWLPYRGKRTSQRYRGSIGEGRGNGKR